MTSGTASPDAVAAQPAAFLGHGNPMNALGDNTWTAAWSRFGSSVGRPRAILVVSAHWYIGATAITTMTKPRTIHDFFGFPPELFAVEYPAPGSPDLAGEIIEAVKPAWVGEDHDSWGLDHGAWSLLVHAFPDADVPVLQLSLDATKPAEYHFELGRRLARLGELGVLVIGSGNVVHNLGMVDWANPDSAFDWARRFDDAARAVLTENPGDVGRLAGHDDYALAVPTPDHYLPMLYLAGIAAERDTAAEVLVDGYNLGSLSMISYTVGTT